MIVDFGSGGEGSLIHWMFILFHTIQVKVYRFNLQTSLNNMNSQLIKIKQINWYIECVVGKVEFAFELATTYFRINKNTLRFVVCTKMLLFV